MKLSIKLICSAALAFVCTAAVAEKGDYINAQLAIADVDGFDDGLAVVATYGLPITSVHKNFSVEGEFTTTLSDPDRAGSEVSYYTLGGYGVYTHPVTSDFKLRGRAGFLYEDVDVSGAGGTVASDDGFELTFGFGITYNISNNMNVIAEYTVIEDDITHLSAGVQYRF